MAHESTPHSTIPKALPGSRSGPRNSSVWAPCPPLTIPTSISHMGKDNEIVCPYCSTLYVFNKALAAGTSEPLSAIYHSEAA